ncbi:MAG TPA: hypothetical protein VFX96_02645, partial [Pyrinomonadaceae bacterium]|nr:hypothetical protein [Pyrinomonadaceae bacterium]
MARSLAAALLAATWFVVASARQATQQRPELVIQTGHSAAVLAVAFSPDGKLIASGGGDRKIKLWDASARAEVRTFTGHAGKVLGVAFSPD